MIAARVAAALLLAACGARGAAPHPAVCRIAVEERDGQAFGSGTLIDARDQYGLVVTNWHVVRDATGKIEVRFPSGFKSEARPLKLDETWDLAALVVWRPPTEPAALAARPPQPGDRLTICGYGGGDYLAQTGHCTDYYSPEVGQPQELVELNVEARQGDSGGPIFNTRGELAGVLFGAAQGSTLGSFGGRVQTFLATLAPDIGRQQTLLARSSPDPSSVGQALPDAPRSRFQALPPANVRQTPAYPSTGPTAIAPGAIDPFQIAERPTPNRMAAAPNGAGAPGTQWVNVQRAGAWQAGGAPPASLADRAAAPQLAAARQPAGGWFAPANGSPSRGFSPQSSGLTAADDAAGVVDWRNDGRNALALLGVAALVVAGLRSLS